MSEARSTTWQEDEGQEETPQAPGGDKPNPQAHGGDKPTQQAKDGDKATWAEFGAQTVLGFVPVVGPAANAVYDFSKGRMVSGTINAISCAADVVSWGTWAAGRAAGSAGKVAVKLAVTEGGEAATKATLMTVTTSNTFWDAAKRLTNFWPSSLTEEAAKKAGGKILTQSVKTVSEEGVEQASKALITKLVASGLTEKAAKKWAKEAVTAMTEQAAELAAEALINSAFCTAVGGAATAVTRVAGECASELTECAFGLTAAHATPAGVGAAPDFVMPADLTVEEVQGRTMIRNPPMRTLQDSNFLKWYNHYPRSPTAQDVESALPTKQAKDVFRSFLRKSRGCLGAAAAKMWTDGHVNMYRKINAALISDNDALLKVWTPLIRALNNYLLRFNSTGSTVVRRKSFLTREQALAIKVGQTYRMCMYVATSTRPFENFVTDVGGDAVRMEFVLPPRCFQARLIEQVTEVKGEQEVLIVPYSGVKVTAVTAPPSPADPVTVHIEVSQDSRSLPLDLPSLLA